MNKKLEHCEDGSYRWRKPNKKFEYYILSKCKKCRDPFLTNKYSDVEYCSMDCSGPKRGRPIKHQLSDKSKERISEGREGKRHSEKTRQKISRATKEYLEAYQIIGSRDFSNRDYSSITTHGMSLTPTWIKWQVMKKRCGNPNDKSYKYYGAKGIKVCKEWSEFINFHNWLCENDWHAGLHLHRVNVEGDYIPDNCVLLTPSEHSKLHAKSRIKHGTTFDKKKYMKQWRRDNPDYMKRWKQNKKDREK